MGKDDLELGVLFQHRRKLVGEADAVVLRGLDLARLIGGPCAECHDAGVEQQRDVQIQARLIQGIKGGIVDDVILHIGVHLDAPENAFGGIMAQIRQRAIHVVYVDVPDPEELVRIFADVFNDAVILFIGSRDAGADIHLLLVHVLKQRLVVIINERIQEKNVCVRINDHYNTSPSQP